MMPKLNVGGGDGDMKFLGVKELLEMFLSISALVHADHRA